MGIISAILQYVTNIFKRTSLPAADTTANTTFAEVIGNKGDAAVTTVGTTKSIMAYAKGILNRMPTSGTVATASDISTAVNGIPLAVPAANSTANTNERDVIGNKSDAAVSDVVTTASLMAYMKALIQELDQRKVGKIIANVASPDIFDNRYNNPVVNISGKGVLTGVAQVIEIWYGETVGRGCFSIIIDGGTEMQVEAFTKTGKSYDGSNITWLPGTNSLSFNHRFNTSLLVLQWQMVNNGDNLVRSHVAYTLEG